MDKIKEVEDFARQRFEKAGMAWFIGSHLEYVERLALRLAEIKGANKDVLRLSAWLHDISHENTSVKEDHHVQNSRFAVKFLRERGFEEGIISAVEHCILTHRCRDEHMPQTLEAKIFASADAMSHIENFSVLLFAAFVLKKYGLETAYNWLSRKIDRDWNRKILIPEGKEMVREKYEEALVMLEKMKMEIGRNS
ncbi:MAG: HD domain-containing protein [Candidatus Aenigmarchaeota archaeon]|nr:HD domain-containing protein [Candidatus Aenigmarchaeota archaeon]